MFHVDSLARQSGEFQPSNDEACAQPEFAFPVFFLNTSRSSKSANQSPFKHNFCLSFNLVEALYMKCRRSSCCPSAPAAHMWRLGKHPHGIASLWNQDAMSWGAVPGLTTTPGTQMDSEQPLTLGARTSTISSPGSLNQLLPKIIAWC